MEALNGDHTQETEKTKSNKELSSSPDVQHKNALNNNNTINSNNNHNGTENTKPRTESVGDEKCLAKDDKPRFGSSKMLPPDDDRILKEMVRKRAAPYTETISKSKYQFLSFILHRISHLPPPRR